MTTKIQCKNIDELMKTIEKNVKDGTVYNININTTTYEITVDDCSALMKGYYASKESGSYTGD
jgi:hypothetical protein